MEEKKRLTKLNDKLYNNSHISQEYPNEYVTKNKRLAINKLAEYENTNLSPVEVEQLKKENEEKDQRIAELEKQLAIRDKALELACIKIEYLRLLDTVTVKKFKEIDVKSFEQRYKERKEDFVEKARKELEDD